MIELESGFVAKFNRTGTHFHKDYVKIRVDIFPPMGSKTYPLQYVEVYVHALTEVELADPALAALVPKHWVLNPCICVFIKVNPEDKRNDIVAKISELIDFDTLELLDSSLSGEAGLATIADIMKNKGGNGRKVLPSENKVKIKSDIDAETDEDEDEQ